jgi:predicted nucleotidyltransferase
MSTHDVFEIAAILVAHAVQTHGAEVAIIAYYGSHAKGLATDTSDLDICYIPDEGKAAGLSSQFVLDGLPYDFWPLDWATAEQIADAAPGRPWAVAASLLADARILYARSPADRARFEALQARVVARTQPESYPFMVGRSLEAFKSTLFRLAQLRLAVAKGDPSTRLAAAWEYVNSVLDCLALLNQTWFAKGWGANTGELERLRRRPGRLEESIRSIVLRPAGDQQLAAADRLTGEVRQILLEAQAGVAVPAPAVEVFKDFFPIVVELAGKVYRACEAGDAMSAGYGAYLLQHEVSSLLNRVRPGFDAADLNLLSEYSPAYAKTGFPDLLEAAAHGDLDELARRVQVLERKLAEWLVEQGINLNIVATTAVLPEFLSSRAA